MRKNQSKRPTTKLLESQKKKFQPRRAYQAWNGQPVVQAEARLLAVPGVESQRHGYNAKCDKRRGKASEGHCRIIGLRALHIDGSILYQQPKVDEREMNKVCLFIEAGRLGQDGCCMLAACSQSLAMTDKDFLGCVPGLSSPCSSKTPLSKRAGLCSVGCYCPALYFAFLARLQGCGGG